MNRSKTKKEQKFEKRAKTEIFFGLLRHAILLNQIYKRCGTHINSTLLLDFRYDTQIFSTKNKNPWA